jgi:YegS/Rv2252/BmrU family lipid kinase
VKQLVFIVNPRSGTDRVKAIESAVATGIDPKQYQVAIRVTERAGHGVDLARDAADQGAFAVVAVGGDGSVNDVATGLYGTNTALGILPKGSGNGFARSLSIPLHLNQAIARINSGNVVAVDVGFANEHLFLSNAGAGFDAEVTDAFAHSHVRGLKTYAEIIMRKLFTYQARPYTLRIDGVTVQEEAFMLVVANGNQFGYNFQIAANADCTDGLFNVVLVRKFPHWAGPFIALDSMRGRMHKNAFVKTWTAKTIELEAPHLQFFQTDGDTRTCNGKVVFRMVPQALKVIC